MKRNLITDGLLYTHRRLNANTGKTLEVAAFVYALIELLEEKGLLTVEELDERKEVVGERLAAQFQQSGMGVVLQDPEYDKYSFGNSVEIDCDERIHLCRAACCRLPFALSKQDVNEGVVQWELGHPYWIAHGTDGYCCHLGRENLRCTVHGQRPVPCRAFDCRNDKRIWLDFEARDINPDVLRSDWPEMLAEKAKVEP